ncbi:Microphthalmia-associated transcription factor [Choanephora cucurbitarum]|uniref:Microphthalmia-associated transcription factor n=1 Tax=Choanephora cucurbitarum TaxID=101091 RepID=A0A1C7NL91_9FUNG|nr:Microphthalmia-associated transcription factor [Choanephora cucurbitarum]OBZ89845.1 Microphthalmia-associated transcription factor [Choanephora cucurbitarum]
MTDSGPSPYKLKNPTAYHLFASQQQQQQHVSLSHLQLDSPIEQRSAPTIDFSEYYRQQQQQRQFLSPESTSPPLQDFDDLDQHGLPLTFSNMMLVPDQQPNNYFFPSQPKINTNALLMASHQHSSSSELFQEESPSDYASSVDHPYRHQRNSSMGSSKDTASLAASPPSFMYNQPFSAPAQTGYEFLTNHMQSITAYHQDKQRSLSHSLVATGANSVDEYESIQINQQLLSEKKRRRRESHNAVERRRRENINERIQELGTLLPEAMLEELACTSVNGNNNKPNKGAILRKSVDHIRLLQHEVTGYKQRILELENQLASLTN